MKLQSVLQWLVIAVMFAVPSLWRFELSIAPTWVCEKDGEYDPGRGKWGGTCHAEPTAYHRLGLSESWDPKYPRIESMQIVSVNDLDLASASMSDPTMMNIRASDACWARVPAGHSWCWGTGFGYFGVLTSLDEAPTAATYRETAAVAERFNSFRRDERERTFRLRRPRPTAWWHFAVYVAATALALHVLRRWRCARAQAFAERLEAIPSTYARLPSTTPYRD